MNNRGKNWGKKGKGTGIMVFNLFYSPLPPEAQAFSQGVQSQVKKQM